MPTIFRDRTTFNGIEFNSTLEEWSGAHKVVLDTLDGWDDTPGVDVLMSPYGVSDGEYASEYFPTRARHLLVGGMIYCHSRAEADNTFDTLVSEAFPVNREISIIRYEPIPRRLIARVSGSIDRPRPVEEGYRFSLPMVAPDPYKYSLAPSVGTSGIVGVSTGGRVYPRVYPLVYDIEDNGAGNQVSIENIGNQPTFPEVTIYGPLEPGWRLTNMSTGEELSVDIELQSVDSLYLNFKTESVQLNGFDVVAEVQGEWWALDRGVSQIRLFGNYNPDASYTVTAYSSWR